MRRSVPSAALAAALLLPLPACGGAPSPAPDESAKARPTRAFLAARTTVPLLEGDQPRVLVEVEGAGPAVFLVDTCAEYSWLARHFVDAHGLATVPVDATLVDINDAEARIEATAVVDRLELGGAYVTDLRPLVVPSIWDGVDGTVGQDLLRTWSVVLDGVGGTLSLVPHGEEEEAYRHLIPPGGLALSYAVDWSTGTPHVTVPVTGLDEALRLRLDTGVGRMTLPREVVEALGLERVGTEVSPGLSGSRPEVGIYDVPRLELQDLVVTGDEALVNPHASLGWGVLRTLIMAFDNADDRLLLFVGVER
jgi:predicted aspartyl protease